MALKISLSFALVAIGMADVLKKSYVASSTAALLPFSHPNVAPSPLPAQPLLLAQPAQSQRLPAESTVQPLLESHPSVQPCGPTTRPADLTFSGASRVPAKYDFEWAVNEDASSNDFGHQETRDGNYAKGSYYVLLPDGHIQRVNYSVQGDSGFVADVTYEVQAMSSVTVAPSPSPQLSYGALEVTSDKN